MINTESSMNRLLEGIPHLNWGGLNTNTDDLMVSSSLRVCLDYIGEKHTKTYLAGMSGAAFDTGWVYSSLYSGACGAIFAHPGHFEPGIDNLFKAIGREHTVAYKSNPDHLQKVAIQSIQSGRPVIASEWEIDHYAILAGYDSERGEFLGRRYGAAGEFPENYISIKPEALSFVIAIGDKTRKIPKRESVLDSLKLAVDGANIGKNQEIRDQGGLGQGKMMYGLDAFAEHARMVLTDLDPKAPEYKMKEHFLFWRLDALHLARSYAVLYLQDIEDVLSPSEKEHAKTAIGNYCRLLGMIESVNIPMGPSIMLDSYEISLVYPRINIFPDDEKIGSAILWCDNDAQIPLPELLSSVKGREKLSNWFLDLRDIEENSIGAISQIVQGNVGNTP